MIFWIESDDIQATELEQYLHSVLLSHSNFLYLTATQNIKRMRIDSEVIGGVLQGNEHSAIQNLYTSSEFVQTKSRQVFATTSFLTNADQKYLLTKVIQAFYKDNSTQASAMLKMRHELWDLFKTLLFNKVQVTDSTIAAILSDFSSVETDIFKIYAVFCEVLFALLEKLMPENISDLANTILENCHIRTNGQVVSTYLDEQKRSISEHISGLSALFFDGFLFFDEMQRYILLEADKLNKPIYILSKQFSDASGNFIYEAGLKTIVDEHGKSIERISFQSPKVNKETALCYVKEHFPYEKATTQPNSDILDDKSIRVIEPFIDRESELRYVVTSISKRLENIYAGDINELIRSLNNDFAIVIGIEKENYEERFSALFREVGLFIFDYNLLAGSEFVNIDRKSISPLYFTKKEYLASDIYWDNSKQLSSQEKLRLFNKGFHRIDINRYTRPISSYPVGQFVLEVYRIINDGISIEGFKSILYSNWQYVADKSIEEKWSDSIAGFRYIEPFFDGKMDISEWIDIIENLIKIKPLIENEPLYHYHPLSGIKIECLSIIRNLLLQLSSIIEKILTTSGGLDAHLQTLKESVMGVTHILSEYDEVQEFEQTILKRLVAVVDELSSSSQIDNIEANYFAQNVHAMLTEWERESASETTSLLRLNVVNLENMKRYKHSYFVMCESGKYPRQYAETFPYSPEIVRILSRPKYGISLSIQDLRGIDYHLKLEKYLFKNVLDFTSDDITFTYCEKEYGTYNKPSIYLEDIASLFNSEIPQDEDETKTERRFSYVETTKKLRLPCKEEYSLTELATFKLCPRLYYHINVDEIRGVYLSKIQLKFYFEAILYCDLFRRFMDYNLQNKKVYKKNDPEYKRVMAGLWRDCISFNKPFFSFLSSYELKDTERNVFRKAYGFIDNAMQYIKGGTYTVINYNEKRYKGNGYTLLVEHDNRIVDYEKKTWRMSQNNIYLEFLVLKTDDNKSELVHYADMIKALDECNPNEDRVNLVSRIIAKINIQFDSKRFAGDGIKRTDELVQEICEYNFLKAVASESNFCTYCRYNETCFSQ